MRQKTEKIVHQLAPGQTEFIRSFNDGGYVNEKDIRVLDGDDVDNSLFFRQGRKGFAEELAGLHSRENIAVAPIIFLHNMNLPGEDNADCIDIITGIKNEAALSKMPSPRTHMLQKGSTSLSAMPVNKGVLLNRDT